METRFINTDGSPFFAEGTEAMVDLEAMVDKVGLRNVVYALSSICEAKAEHVQINWQDKVLAKEWKYAARKLDTFASKCGISPMI